MFPIRRYQNQNQTGGNCREALTLDLKFQVSWNPSSTFRSNPSSGGTATNRSGSAPLRRRQQTGQPSHAVVPCPRCYRRSPEQTPVPLHTGSVVARSLCPDADEQHLATLKKLERSLRRCLGCKSGYL